MTAPVTAFAARNSPGATTGAFGGARLPALKNAAKPAQPAAVLRSASSAAFIAALRFSSVGCLIHSSVALSDAWIGGSGSSPADRRAHIQAHHTASRFGI